MKNSRKTLYIIGSIALIIVESIVILNLVKRMTDTLYKKSHEPIDFDKQGPEIVKKEKKEV